MINELKLVLDMVGDLSGIALWVIVAFILWKLVMYLSTVGSIVYILKLFIEKLHDVLTAGKLPKSELNEHLTEIENICIFNDGAATKLKRLLRRELVDSSISSYCYIHREAVDWLEEAIFEYKQNHPEKFKHK